ncbi:MAG: chromate transporter [Thermaerobacterales bacterium]
MILLELYLAFLKVGAFAIGGAYALVPLMQREIVSNYGWLSGDEFLEVFGLSAAIPGAISIKVATYTGFKVAGWPGVVAANLGHFTVPALLMLVLFGAVHGLAGNATVESFLGGVRAGTWGLLLGFAVYLARSAPFDLKALAIAIPAFVGIGFFNLHPGMVLIGSGLVGIMLFR